MLKWLKIFRNSLLLLFVLVNVANAESERFYLVKPELAMPEIDAKAWALFEFESGKLVMGFNADKKFPPASITKLMTNYVVYQAIRDGRINLNDQVKISEKAWRAEGSRMFAKVNSLVSVEQLLKSTTIQSGNDAAIALAEHVGGSEFGFAQMMNQAASEIGLSQSSFENSTGLPSDAHLMTAEDIAKLSAAIIRDYPDFYKAYAQKSFSHNEITQYNRNKLLWKDPSVDGLKTGHTEAAGFCLVGSAKRNDQRWIAVVLGSKNEKSREQAVMTLLDFAFAAFRPVAALDQQGGVATAKVFYGQENEVLLKPEAVAKFVVPTGKEKSITVDYQLSPYYEAPVAMGQQMGVATISLGNQDVISVPLVAMNKVDEGSIWKRLTDHVKLAFVD